MAKDKFDEAGNEAKNIVGAFTGEVEDAVQEALNDPAPDAVDQLVVRVTSLVSEYKLAVGDFLSEVIALQVSDAMKRMANETDTAISFDLVNEASVEALETTTKARLFRIADDMLIDIQGTTERYKAMIEASKQGIQGGLTLKESQSAFSAMLQEIGLATRDEDGTWRIEINGKNYQLDKYAEMAVQTTMAQADKDAIVNGMLAEGLDVVEMSAHYDNRLSKQCEPLQGKRYALTEKAAKREGIRLLSELPNGGPPIHPNCRHYLIPVVE